MCEMVEWKPVPGFDGAYEASTDGDIRSLRTGKLLPKKKMGAGYIKADLHANGDRRQTSAHRVIAATFIGSVDGFEVNHINGDKTDNRVCNLEIVTKSQNEQHSRSQLRNLVKAVVSTNLATGEEIEFESVESAARHGFVASSIYRCCYGICKKHRGHAFRFKDQSSATHAIVNLGRKKLAAAQAKGGE